MSCGDGRTQIRPATLILAACTSATSSWWTSNLSLGRASVLALSLCLLLKPNSVLQAKPGKRSFIFVRPSRILATNKTLPLISMKTIWHVQLKVVFVPVFESLGEIGRVLGLNSGNMPKIKNTNSPARTNYVTRLDIFDGWGIFQIRVIQCTTTCRAKLAADICHYFVRERSRLGLSSSSLCAQIKWSPTPWPRAYPHQPSSATAVSW